MLERPIQWTFHEDNPIITPGQLNGRLDAKRAGGGQVVKTDECYRMYYWGMSDEGVFRTLMAESPLDAMHEWEGKGVCLEPEKDNPYNCRGPSVLHVLAQDDAPWFLYFAAWGDKRADNKLPNTTFAAISHDKGISWEYWEGNPLFKLEKPWEKEGTGTACAIRDGDRYRMYYTAIGEYFEKPAYAESGHGDRIARVGIAYAESDDGLHWEKPVDWFLIPPRGADMEPFEYWLAKPFVLQEAGLYRMWVSTFGPAYRVRSLISRDGIHWKWMESDGELGELGIGEPGTFDAHQRSYASLLREGDTFHVWYTGNQFGLTGMGYAEGRIV